MLLEKSLGERDVMGLEPALAQMEVLEKMYALAYENDPQDTRVGEKLDDMTRRLRQLRTSRKYLNRFQTQETNPVEAVSR